MSSMWTHSICEECWFKHFFEKTGFPIRIAQAHRRIEKCCFCLNPHASGIYVRQDPASTACKGKHSGRIE